MSISIFLIRTSMMLNNHSAVEINTVIVEVKKIVTVKNVIIIISPRIFKPRYR